MPANDEIQGQKKLIFSAPGHIQSVKTLVDGTVKLDVAVSRELAPEHMATLFEARKAGQGWFLFSPNDLDMVDIPNEPASGGEKKTPSQRMYAVLFLRWKMLTDQNQPFDDYYRDTMEKIISNLKTGLPERE